MRKVLLLLVVAVTLSAISLGQEFPRAEVFGGYSYVRGDLGNSGTDGSKLNLNGWNGSVAINANKWLGFVADFGGQYGSPDFGIIDSTLIPEMPLSIDVHNLDVSFHSYQFGPRISFRSDRATVFAHGLFGATRAKIKGSMTVTIETDEPPPVGNLPSIILPPTETMTIQLDETENAFSMALGGGVDVKVTDRIAIRAVQLDYQVTRFFEDTQNNLRLGTGIVFRF